MYLIKFNAPKKKARIENDSKRNIDNNANDALISSIQNQQTIELVATTYIPIIITPLKVLYNLLIKLPLTNNKNTDNAN